MTEVRGARLAARMAQIRPFRVMQLLAKARDLEAQGRDIVHMEVGEPDFATPEPVVTAGRAALAAGLTHYTAAVGLPALREAVAADYGRRYGVAVDPRRVLITPGASGALQLALAVLVDPGAGVLLPDPGYPCNRNFVHLFGGIPQPVPVDAASGFQPLAERLDAHVDSTTRALMLASPSNPTGTVLSRERLQEICEWAQAHQIALVVDEIYHGLVYGADAVSIVEFSDQAFVINSFSKYFGMTGWRLGWILAPDDYVESLDTLAQNLFLAAPTPAQHAALAAFHPETVTILEQRRAEFGRRRDFLVPALRALGFDIPVEPQGAFYIYADCHRFSRDSVAFCARLLDEAGVAITPGTDFGTFEAATHVRFAYTTSMEKLAEGVRRLEDYLG